MVDLTKGYVFNVLVSSTILLERMLKRSAAVNLQIASSDGLGFSPFEVVELMRQVGSTFVLKISDTDRSHFEGSIDELVDYVHKRLMEDR